MALPAPFGVCPICKHPLSIEMLPVGINEVKEGKKKKEKPMAVFDKALSQTIRWSGEMLARAAVAALTVGIGSNVPAKRRLYLTCNFSGGADGAPACTACYSLKNPVYFESLPYGAFALVGDVTGMTIEMMRASYNMKKKMFDLQQALKKKK